MDKTNCAAVVARTEEEEGQRFREPVGQEYHIFGRESNAVTETNVTKYIQISPRSPLIFKWESGEKNHLGTLSLETVAESSLSPGLLGRHPVRLYHLEKCATQETREQRHNGLKELNMFSCYPSSACAFCITIYIWRGGIGEDRVRFDRLEITEAGPIVMHAQTDRQEERRQRKGWWHQDSNYVLDWIGTFT